MADETVTSDDKLWAMLAYIFSPLVPVVLLFIESKKNRPFIKAHNVQALVLGVILLVINSALTPVLGLGCITAIATLVIMIYLGIQAYNGKQVNIPIITDFVKKQGWA